MIHRRRLELALRCATRRWAVPADEDGQGLAEYALILALIAIVALVSLIFLGGQISDILSQVGDSLQ